MSVSVACPPGASPVDRPDEGAVRWRSAAARVVLGWAVVTAVMITAGKVLIGPLSETALVRWDVRAVRSLAANRTAGLDSLSHLWSRLADAPSIVAVGMVVAVGLAVGKRWREIAMLAAILATELATFLSISYLVDRERPEVSHLGSVPSTGSFPSGHIAATVVLYGFVSVLLGRLGAPRAVQMIAIGWTVLAAVFVGWARVYRGMHHPLDVVGGAIMGTSVLLFFVHATRASVTARRRWPVPSVPQGSPVRARS